MKTGTLIPTLRDTKKPDEIIMLLGMAINRKTELYVWQNLHEERKKIPAYISGINIKNSTIEVRNYFPNPVLNFNKKLELYIHYEDNTLIFKTDIISSSSNLATLKIPTIIKIVENRVSPRFEIEQKKNCNISVHKLKTFKTPAKDLLYTGIDVSKSGISFTIFSHDLSKFAVDDTVLIKSISGVEFNSLQKAKIAHICPYEIKKEESKLTSSKAFKIGIALTNDLENIILEDIHSKK